MTYDWSVLDRMKNYAGDPMLPFQKEGVRMMAPRRHNLLADEMGLGKTVQAIALMDVCRMTKVLFIVKASIKGNWKRKIEEWSVNRHSIQIINKKTDDISEFADVVIVNYDIINHSYMHHQLTQIKWDMVCADEAHMLKTMETKRTQAVLAKGGLVHFAKRTLMMTGTPILNRPSEIYPMLKVLCPPVLGPYRDYYRYAKRYCGGFPEGGFDDRGSSNESELNLKLRQYYMIRRLTHEVKIQLPEKRYEIVFVDSSKKVQDRLRVLDGVSRKDFRHQTFDDSSDPIATIRREAAESKLEATLDYIQDCVSGCDKIVIFAYHHSIIRKLREELSEFSPVVLSGSSTSTQRDEVIKKFQKDTRCKVFIGQIQAAGEGIDGLQDICSNVLFVEWSWVPGEIEQACKRVHRIGQKQPVLFRFLVWSDSIEEHIMRVALDKVAVIKKLLK